MGTMAGTLTWPIGTITAMMMKKKETVTATTKEKETPSLSLPNDRRGRMITTTILRGPPTFPEVMGTMEDTEGMEERNCPASSCGTHVGRRAILRRAVLIRLRFVPSDRAASSTSRAPRRRSHRP